MTKFYLGPSFRINLIVFDECHLARKKHPMNQIMQFYKVGDPNMPKIFGMTVSKTRFPTFLSEIFIFSLTN